MQTKNLTAFILSIAAMMVIGIVSACGDFNSFNKAGAEGSGYSIPFTSTTNKFSSSSGTQSIVTSSGNPISFSYSGYSGALGKWGNLAVGGYIANQTALSGLTSLSVTYGSATGNLAISYGWWDEAAGAISYEVTNGQITSSSTTYNFDGYTPSFLKITASATAQISSMTLAYSCQASPAVPLSKITLALFGDGTSYSVIDCIGSVTTIVIPSTYRGLSVTSIGDYAFSYCSSLTSITIPSSVTSIGSYAFENCPSLTSITIPSSVTTIGNSAFQDCYALTSITIPSSVTSIGSSAFYSCTSLTSITIPSSVTSIGSSAFSNCTSLTSITIPSSMTSIPSNAFYYCTSLTSIVIPSSVTSIGDYAFYACVYLPSIAIPSSVTSIGSWAFSSCNSLTSIAIPSSVTSIGASVFEGCSKLSIKCQASSKPSGWASTWNSSSRPVTWASANRGTVTSGGYTTGTISWTTTYAYLSSWSGTGTTLDLPSSVGGYTISSIASTFTGYSAIKYLRIPDSVITISANSMKTMSALNTIIIGSGVTSIGAGAFTGSLPTNTYSTVYFKGTPTQWTALGFTYFEANGFSMVYYSETEHLPDANYYWHYDVDGMTPIIWGI